MGTFTKILVILTFLASVAVAVGSLKVADRLAKQDAIIKSLVTSGAAQKDMASSWDAVLGSAKEKVTNLQAEADGARGELVTAQESAQSAEQSLLDAQATSTQEIAALQTKNTELVGMVAAEKAKVVALAKAPRAAGGKQPVGRVMSVSPEKGITAYFSGTATINDGDSMNVYREKKNIGKVVISKVKQTVVICTEGEGSTAVPVKGDLVRK